MKTVAIIVAAGRSERFGGTLPKQFHEIAGRPVLAWTIQRFESAASIDSIVLVVAEDYMGYVSERIVDPNEFTKVTTIVPGGDTRQASVLGGLNRLSATTELAAIHDGARMLVSPDDIDAAVTAAERDGAAILATQVTDTVKRASDGIVVATLDRNKLWLAQTPQVFRYETIVEAHQRAAEDGREVTDDAALLEESGTAVTLVQAKFPNPKITSQEDMMMVEALMTGVAGEHK